MRLLPWLALLASCLGGCGLFQKGSVFPSDLQKIEECVAQETITGGVTDVTAIINACGPETVVTVIDAIQILINAGKLTPAHAAALQAYRSSHAR